MADVIQEFLVSLGYKLNEDQQQRFDAMMVSNTARTRQLENQLAALNKQVGVLGQQLADVTSHRKAEDALDRLNRKHAALERNVKSFGLVAAASTGTYIAGLIAIAEKHEELYYVQQRTGVGANALAGYGFVGQQIGVGPQAMVQAAESMATAARSPGIAAMMRAWGLMARNGQLADDALKRFVEHVRNYPPYLQDAYANMFGVPITLMRNYINNTAEADAATKDWADRVEQSGLRYADVNRHAVDVTRDLSKLWGEIGIIATQGFEEAFPAMDTTLKKLDELLKMVAAFNKENPGAALAENMVAAGVAAAGLLATLGKITGLPLLRYGVAGALLWGAGKGAEEFGKGATPEGAREAEDRRTKAFGERPWWIPHVPDPAEVVGRIFNVGRGNTWQSHIPLATLDWWKAQFGERPGFAEGGIVPINAHAGEIVLPQSLSSMLLSVAQGRGGEIFATYLREWLQGSQAHIPFVQVVGLTPGAPMTAAGSGTVPTYHIAPPDGGSGGPVGLRDNAGRMVAPKIGGGGGVGGRPGGGNNVEVPNVDNMTPAEKNFLGLVLQHESGGGQNILNYVGRRQGLDPRTRFGYTAQGYYQMLNSHLFGKLGQSLGLHAPNVMALSLEDQTRLALALSRGPGGWGHWLNWNPKLREAVMRGDKAHTRIPVPDIGKTSPSPTGELQKPLGEEEYRRQYPTGILGSPEHPIPSGGGSGDAMEYRFRTGMLGGSTTNINNHAGDRNATVNMTNHFHGSGEANDDSLRGLHQVAGYLSRNVFLDQV